MSAATLPAAVAAVDCREDRLMRALRGLSAITSLVYAWDADGERDLSCARDHLASLLWILSDELEYAVTGERPPI